MPAPDQPPLAQRPLQELILYLYGLYPNNTLRFIRGPALYFDKSEWTPPWSTPPDQSEYQILQLEHTVRRAQPFFEGLIVHPLLLTKLSDTEFSDLTRFQHSEPSSVVALCESLIADRGYLEAEETTETMPQTVPADELLARRASLPTLDATTARSGSGSRDVTARPVALARHLAQLRTQLDYDLHLRYQHRQLMSSIARDSVARAGFVATQQTLVRRTLHAR